MAKQSKTVRSLEKVKKEIKKTHYVMISVYDAVELIDNEIKRVKKMEIKNAKNK